MPISVLIAGAGIAGLTAAISLRRAGHRVTVYERSNFSNEVGAAFCLPPNAARPLLAWGMDLQKSKLVEAEFISIVDGTTLETQTNMKLGEWVKQYCGAPFYFSHRVDLHEMLRLMAVDEGMGERVRIKLGRKVISYDPETPSLTLASGEVIKADLVVCADGIHSIGVEAVLNHPYGFRPMEVYNGCYRCLIADKDIVADKETAWFSEGGTPGAEDGGPVRGFRAFTNGERGNRFVTYPCRSGELWNCIGMFHSDSSSFSTRTEDWHSPSDKDHLLESFSDFHPSIRAVLNKATEINCWPLLSRKPIPTWTKGKMVIIGDAAHPMLPHQGQGGAQSIEDGVALGIALSGLTENNDIVKRLKAFEQVRRPRASAMQVISNVPMERIGDVKEEAARYMKGVPSGAKEFVIFNWAHDVVKTIEETVKKLDKDFKVPTGYFKGNPYLP